MQTLDIQTIVNAVGKMAGADGVSVTGMVTVGGIDHPCRLEFRADGMCVISSPYHGHTVAPIAETEKGVTELLTDEGFYSDDWYDDLSHLLDWFGYQPIREPSGGHAESAIWRFRKEIPKDSETNQIAYIDIDSRDGIGMVHYRMRGYQFTVIDGGFRSLVASIRQAESRPWKKFDPNE